MPIGAAFVALFVALSPFVVTASAWPAATVTGRELVQARDDTRNAEMWARHAERARDSRRAVSASPRATVSTIEISRDTIDGPAGSQDDTQIEPHIAVDPGDPDVVVGVFQQGRFGNGGGSVAPGWAASNDGGATWTRGNLPALTVATGGVFERATDPVVAIGPDGAVYANTLALDASGCRTAIAVQRSDDHGSTFAAPVLAHDDTSCSVFNDKNWLAVDTFSASPFVGRLYAVWDQARSDGQPILLRRSGDRGQTWSAVTTVSSPFAITIGAIPLVQANGDLTIVYESSANEVSQTSHDGGVTFDAPVTIADFEGAQLPDMRTGGLPAAAVDATTGRLYVVWQDTRFRNDGLNDIVLSRSSDGGQTWSTLQRVNPDPTTSDLEHFTPAVAAANGAVYVTYRTRDASGGGSDFVDMRFIVSSNGGNTFCGEQVLGAPADLQYAALAGSQYFLGDYMGVAVSPVAVHPIWCRSFADPMSAASHHQSTWSTALAPGASCAPPGPTEEHLNGSRLKLAPESLALALRDPAITIGSGDGGPDDPVLYGATLRVVSQTAGLDVTYDLPASNWQYVGSPGDGRGYRYKDRLLTAGPIASAVIKRGKSVTAKGHGMALVQPLATDPDPVDVVLSTGARRYCARFGGEITFDADRRYIARKAPPPLVCAP